MYSNPVYDDIMPPVYDIDVVFETEEEVEEEVLEEEIMTDVITLVDEVPTPTTPPAQA